MGYHPAARSTRVWPLLEKWGLALQKTLDESGKSRLVAHGLLPNFKEIIEVEECKFCPTCGVLIEDKGPDRVCVKCGRVYGHGSSEQAIPFEEESVEAGRAEGHYGPVNNSDYGRALGSKIDTKTKASVFGVQEDWQNQYSRASNARIKLDEPLIKEFLDEARRFWRKHGLDSDWDENQIRFRDQVGFCLRLLGEYFLKYQPSEHKPWIIAASVYNIVLKDFYPERYASLQGKPENPELSIDPAFIEYYKVILEGLQKPLLPKLPPLLQPEQKNDP